jgi:hypothetical protein
VTTVYRVKEAKESGGLEALDKKSAEEGLVLTEAQVAALERKRDEQMECGEIETAHPGLCGDEKSQVQALDRTQPGLP